MRHNEKIMLNDNKIYKNKEILQNYIEAKYNAKELEEWIYCKLFLKNTIPEPFYSHFILPLIAFIDNKNNVYIYCENQKIIQHIEIRYLDIIRNTLNSIYKEIKKIQILKEEIIPDEVINTNTSQYDRELNSVWDYGLFYPAEQNLSEIFKIIKLDKYFRPIFIYGPSGCGKTSLAKTWKKIHHNKVFYTTLSEFISEFIISIKKKNVADYLQNIKNHPILIIDDLQNLKPTARKFQEEIKSIIDFYHQNNKVLIFFADRDINFLNLEKSLYSRFITFHKIHLFYPDYKTKLEIIKYYLKKYNLELNQNIIQHLALHLNGDVRYIQSSIEKLSLSRINPNHLKLQEIDLLLAEYLRNPENIDIDIIIDIVCQYYKVSKEEILSARKEKRVSLARHIIAYLAVKLSGKTLTYVAKYIKRKDHTGVLYALHKIDELLGKDLFFQNELETLKELIWNQYYQISE